MALNFNRRTARRVGDHYRVSGGQIPHSATGAQALVLFLQQRRLKADFYRRQSRQSR